MALTEEQRAELAKQAEVELRAGLEVMGKENNPGTPSPSRLAEREIRKSAAPSQTPPISI